MNSTYKTLLTVRTFLSSYKKITGIIALIIIVGVYYFIHKSAPTALTVTYGRARFGSIQQTVSGVGQVSATSQVDLKPKVNANVTQVLVAPGDKVYKGQVLFRLDARDAYKQVRDAQLSLDQANIALKKLKEPAQTIDVVTLQNAIKKVLAGKVTQNTAVETAYATLLSSSLQAVPDVSYTSEIAPTITGTYQKGIEGQIHFTMTPGTEGAMISYSGVISGTVLYSSSVAQPLGDSGLFIKFASPSSSVNWTIDIPNKRSSSYLSLYTTYMNAKQSRDIGNADADRQITEYNQKLDDLQKGAKDIDIAAQELSVQQRQNALTDANNTLSDYTIVAPFDGTMASVSGQVGLSAVTAASNGATSLGTIVTDKKLIQVTLNETDIAKVHIGQPATITFDALDGVTATGTVADIDGLGTITQGVVTYKVKIFFASTDDRIKSSMSASAIITTDSKENVLVIQSSALKHDTSGYYVESDGSTFTSSSSQAFASSTRRFMRATSTEATSTRMGGYSSTSTRSTSTRSIERQARTATLPSTTQLAKIPVTIGIQGDSLTEIVSGLTEGQQIIIKKTTGTAKATAAPSITSLFRPGGQNQRQGAAVRAQ